jgi:1-acyl-sn-glycerol-3-phosphate acyltransferase
MTGNLLYSTGQVICRIVTTTQFDLRIRGTEHIPLNGGVLIASNHQSLLDPVLIGVQVKRPLSYLAKSELFENPRFSWLIRNLYAFPARQEPGDITAVREAIRRLQEGRALVIFPEGSRTENGELLPLQPGVGLIVRKADVPVVPALIEGSFKAWPRGGKLCRQAKIRVQFGPAMQLSHLKAAAVVQRIDQTMHRIFEELRQNMLREGW